MQVWLPYADFHRSLKCLDRQRLGKQRIECVQMLRALSGEGKGGWLNHPITQAWKGYEYALALYGQACCQEWLKRGYVDNQKPIMGAFLSRYEEGVKGLPSKDCFPPWLGVKAVHLAYRRRLTFKAPDYYAQFNWGVEPEEHMPYDVFKLSR